MTTFVPVELAAHAAGIPVARMRVWAVRYRDRITVACDRRTRKTVFCLADVMRVEAATRPARATRMRDQRNETCNTSGTATHA